MKQRHGGFPETPADDRIRQGHIVLNTPGRRVIFFGGFVLLGVFCLFAVLIALA